MAASLGWMSRNGLFPTPIDTISFRRISETQKKKISADDTQQLCLLCGTSSCGTFVPGGLGPQDSGDVSGPGVFDVRCGGLKDEGLILGRPPPEPDLKPQPVVSCRLRQAHICCLKDKEESDLQV